MSNSQVLDPANELAEEGYPLPEAEPAGNLPPGSGRLAIPHYLTFSQVVNIASRSYRWGHDEALRHSQTNALALRRDPVVMDALRSRQIPVVQLPWHIEAIDDTDQRQIDAVKLHTEILHSIPRFQDYKRHLTEAVFFGRYAIQNVFRWDYSTGQRRLVVGDYKPINGDKLVFRYSGQPGVLVHPGFYRGDTHFTDRGLAHFFTPEEREQLVIHKHEPEDSDFMEGELGGAIHGVGIRSRIYWIWWLRSQVLAFLMDYLERVGAGGFTVYYFEAGNPESMREIKLAAEEQWRHNSVLFPRYRDGQGGPGIQRIEPSPAGAQLLESLVTNYFDNTIRRFILGQSLTSEAIGTGLGSGVADLHADTFSRIIKYDAVALEETLTQDLLKVLYKYNSPGVPVGRFRFDVDKPNARAVLDAANSFYEMGGEIDEDELRSIIGLAKPAPGAAVLAQVNSLSPAGVGAMPQGVPMEGQPGPLGAGGGDMGMAQGGAEEPFLFGASGDKVRFERQGDAYEPPMEPGVEPSFDPKALERPATHYQPDLGFEEPEHLRPLHPDTKEELHGLVSEGALTHDDLWTLKKKDVAKFLQHRKQVSVEELTESAKAGRAKRGWYAKIHPYLKAVFPRGVDAERFAGLLAAVSPRIPVDRSLHLALDIWREWNEAGRPSDSKQVRRLLNQATQKWKRTAYQVHKGRGFTRNRKGEWRDAAGKLQQLPTGLIDVGEDQHVPWAGPANFPARLKNSVHVLSQPDDTIWDSFSLSGNKVNAFYQNMIGNDQVATLDAWMANFWDIKQDLFANKVSYQAFTSSIKTAANRLTQETGEKWSTAEVQETVWSFFRALSRLQGQKKLDPIQALSDVTHGDVGEVIDFVSETVNNPHVQARLKVLIGEHKVGEVLEKLRTLDPQALGQSQGQHAASRPAVTGDSPVLRRVAERAGKYADAFKGRLKYAADEGLISQDPEPDHPEELSTDWQGRIKKALGLQGPSPGSVTEPQRSQPSPEQLQQIMSHGSLGAFVDRIKSGLGNQGKLEERGSHAFEELWGHALGENWKHTGRRTQHGFDYETDDLDHKSGQKLGAMIDTKLLAGNDGSVRVDVDSAKAKYRQLANRQQLHGRPQIPAYLVYSKKYQRLMMKLGIESFSLSKPNPEKDLYTIGGIRHLEDFADPTKVQLAKERVEKVLSNANLEKFQMKEQKRQVQTLNKTLGEASAMVDIFKTLGMPDEVIAENTFKHILAKLSPEALTKLVEQVQSHLTPEQDPSVQPI